MVGFSSSHQLHVYLLQGIRHSFQTTRSSIHAMHSVHSLVYISDFSLSNKLASFSGSSLSTSKTPHGQIAHHRHLTNISSSPIRTPRLHLPVYTDSMPSLNGHHFARPNINRAKHFIHFVPKASLVHPIHKPLFTPLDQSHRDMLPI